MNANKALWEKGDFTRLAKNRRGRGDTRVGMLGIAPGLKVLDLGCGDGMSALPAAKLGAEVLGIDIAGNLVAARSRRAQQYGLANCRFQECDACDLGGLADDSFDLVVSLFGAMFAPRPFEVARQMVRVTRPGGRIVMGNWIPDDPTLVAQALKICAAYAPPPPDGFVSPLSWGIEANVVERFGAAGVPRAHVACRRDTFTFDFPGTPSELLDVFRRYDGPTMNAFEAARRDGRAAELQQALEALFQRQNTSLRSGFTTLAATYLRVTVAVD